MKKNISLYLIISSFVLLFSACSDDTPGNADFNNKDTKQNAKKEVAKKAETAADAIKNISQGLKNNQPQVFWDSLPKSYQKDVNDVVHDFANRMDKDLYNQSIGLVTKVVDILKNKKEFIFNSMLMASPQAQEKKADVEKQWDPVVEALEALVSGDVADLDKLKTINVGDYLANNGGTLMKKLAFLKDMEPPASPVAPGSKPAPVKNKNQTYDKVTDIKLASSEGDNAEVAITYEDKSVETLKMVKVEGKWIEADMAKSWASDIANAKKELAKMTPEAMAKVKAQSMMIIGMANGVITQLSSAKTQAEFDQAINGLMMMAMGGMGGKK